MHPGGPSFLSAISRHLIVQFTLRVLLIAALHGILVSDHASGQAVTREIRFERQEFEIGTESGPPQPMFERIVAVTAASGKLFVLDGGQRAVLVFDLAGKHLYSMGREGAGPGEFRQPLRVAVGRDVRIFDGALRRVTAFSLEGELISTQPLAGEHGAALVVAYPLANRSFIGVTASIYSPGTPSHNPYVAVIHVRTDARADTLIRYRSGGVVWTNSSESRHWGVVDGGLGDGGAYALLGDSVVATVDGYGGTIRWFRLAGDRMAPVAERTLGIRGTSTGREDERRIEAELRRTRPSFPPRVTLELPPLRSAATDAFFASDGMLWVKASIERAVGGGTTWLGSRAGDAAITRLVVPPGVELRAIDGTRAYTVAASPLGAPVVRVFRLIL